MSIIDEIARLKREKVKAQVKRDSIWLPPRTINFQFRNFAGAKPGRNMQDRRVRKQERRFFDSRVTKKKEKIRGLEKKKRMKEEKEEIL